MTPGFPRVTRLTVGHSGLALHEKQLPSTDSYSQGLSALSSLVKPMSLYLFLIKATHDRSAYSHLFQEHGMVCDPASAVETPSVIL